jgi:hypothetical protein
MLGMPVRTPMGEASARITEVPQGKAAVGCNCFNRFFWVYRYEVCISL